MAQQDRAVLIICSYDLAETSAFSNNITDLHGKTSFQVAFACARDPLCRKGRMSYDKSAMHILIMISRSAVIIVCQCIQIKFFHQFLLGHRDFCGPVELLLRRFLQMLVQVAHLKHLEMRACLCLEHRKVTVHIQHATV